MIRRALCIFLLLAVSGCNKNPTTPPASVSTSPPTLDIRPITPLLPRLPTHLTLDLHGNLFWVQESDPPLPGGDLTFVMGEGGVPQSLAALNLDQILATLDLIGGKGAIQSLAVGPDDQLYVLFAGSRRRETICTVLQYNPATRKLYVLADTARLMTASNLGASIALARGTLLGSRDALWLWLRHSDGVALLKFTVAASGTLTLTPVTVTPPAELRNFRLFSDREDLSLTSDGRLYFVDRSRATLWHIGPDGQLTSQMSLLDVSSGVTPPAAHDGHLYFLVGSANNLSGPEVSSAQGPSPLAQVNALEPALFDYNLSSGSVQAVDRVRMNAPTNLPLQTLQPRQILWDAATGTFVTFDAGSGEILRLKVVNP